MLLKAIILAGTAAAGGEGEGGADEQNAEDAADAAAAGEDADNSNTNAGDKPSTTSGKSQHDDAADKSAADLAFSITSQEFDIPSITKLHFLANVNSCSCSLYVVVRPSVCRLSVCNVRAPYLADWNFRQCYCAI